MGREEGRVGKRGRERKDRGEGGAGERVAGERWQGRWWQGEGGAGEREKQEREGQGRGRGRGHKDSFTSLPPCTTHLEMLAATAMALASGWSASCWGSSAQLQWATWREGHIKVSEGTHCMDHADKGPNGPNTHTCTVGRWGRCAGWVKWNR